MELPEPYSTSTWAPMSEWVTWLAAAGIPISFDERVPDAFRKDLLECREPSVLAFLQVIHTLTRGSRIRFTPEGRILIETDADARDAWWSRSKP